MTNTLRILTAVFATMLVFATGCATDTDEAPDDELEAFTEPVETESIDVAAASAGCSKAELKRGIDRCHLACSTRGSNGIHYCKHKPKTVHVQCDCKTPPEPIFTWKL